MKKLSFAAILVFTALQIFAADYFWVGGSGNWSDFANKWATSSGGNVFHTQSPAASDNVFFDQNSFPAEGAVVTIDTDAVCADMIWWGVLNNPRLAGTTSRKISFHGSLALANQMDFGFLGDVYFLSELSARTITLAGQILKRNVYFQGVGGWILQDEFQQMGASVFLERGTLDFNNQHVTVNTFGSYFTHVRTLLLKNSTFTITSNSSSAFYFRGENFNFNAGTSTMVFTGTGAGISHWSNLGNGLAFHNVVFHNSSSSTASNKGGSFNSLSFDGPGTLTGGNTINELIFNSGGTINTDNNNILNLAAYGAVTVNGNGVYGAATLHSNGSITGNNTFEVLTLSPGFSYVLTSGRTQLIVNELTANGSCAGQITLQSSVYGSQSSISKTAGTVVVNYASLRDINASGGATFTAPNSVNLGNNSGWSITQASAQNLYWVGGSGNWNDPGKWSLTSGGSGGACIPTSLDNVFFDANSFTGSGQSVTLIADGSGGVNCHTMNWAGVLHNPAFSGSAQTQLNIHGSLTLSPAMIYDFAGIVNFTGINSNNTLFTAGILMQNNHLYFDGEGVTWTLLDDLDIGTRNIYLVRGSLNTNDKPVTAGQLQSWYSGNVRALKLGSSELIISSTSGSAVYIHGTGMSLDAGTSQIRFTGAGSGMYNHAGGGLFFNDVIFEAITGTVNVYNLNGGFNTLVYHTTGTGRLYYSNAVDSIYFAGAGGIFSDNNTIAKVVTGSSLTLSGNNSTYNHLTVGGTAAFSGSSIYGDVMISGNSTIGGNSTYDYLSIGGDASITGTNTFGTLSLSAGRQITLTSGKTQTILTDLLADGTETELIIIRSSTEGSQSSIQKDSGTISLNYISLRDNNATGGASFVASNSFDMGNNSGWTINMPAGKDYYWVGGTGNWDDISKWSLTSGGEGGAGIPSLNDNVFFDANSFSAADQVVTIMGDAANDVYCLNMDWSGALHTPALDGASTQNLRIHGSLTFNADMNFAFQGLTWFHSKVPGNTLTTSGVALSNNHLYFDGEGGEWTLQDDLNIGIRILYHVRGTLNTNNKTVTAGQLQSWYTGNVRALKLGSSELIISSTSGSAVYIHGTGMSLDAGTSQIRFTGAGSGMYNHAGGGLFFNDVIFEATTGTVNVYNLNGGFNTLVYHTTGTGRLYYSNIVDSIYFAGTGYIHSNNNQINMLVFNADGFIYDNGTFGYTLMNRNGSVFGNNTFDILEFTPGNTYTLTAGRTQTILSEFRAYGTCIAPITIRSSSTTSHTTISKAEGEVNIHQSNLQGLNALGGAVFTAENSVDTGNNTGWEFTEISQDLFWVGGSGNWSDGDNWAATSGGAGGFCVPSRADNVYFDQHSFQQDGQAVFINIENAICASMDWSGALYSPTLTTTSNTNNLRIHGALVLNAEMNFTFSGITYFEGNSADGDTMDISMAGRSFNNAVHFTKPEGIWRLQDNFNAGSNDLYLTSGTLITNDKTLNFRRFISNNNNLRTLVLGGSVLNVSSGNSTSAWYVTGDGFTIDRGTSEIRLTTAGAGFLSTSVGVLSYHNIVFSNPGGSSILNSNHSFTRVDFIPAGKVTGGGSIEQVSFSTNGEIEGNHTFGQVTFFNNALVKGENTFGILKFNAGRIAILESSKTQTINDDLILWGTSENPVYLQSSIAGSQASVSKSSGAVEGNYVHLTDMNASGGAEFKVYNSEDLGNNTGWSFLEPPFVTCQQNQSVCINVAPFALDASLPRGGVYAGNGVYYSQEDMLWFFDPAQAGAGDAIITYTTPFDTSCEFTITVLPLPEIICRENIEVLALSSYITLYEGVGEYSLDGEVITGFNPAEEGTYNIVFTMSNDCGEISCDFLLIVGPPIIVEIEGETEICEGEFTTLTASPEGLSYLWSTGATTRSIDVNASGTYSVIVTFEDNYTSSAQATVAVFSLPAVQIEGDLAFCSDQPILLTANPEGGTYLWSTTSVEQSITITEPGTYSVTVTDVNGCISSGEIKVSAFPGIAGTFSTVSPMNNTYGIKDPITFSWDASENAGSYDLYVWRNSQPRPTTPFVSGITATSHTNSVYLNKNYIYHWQIVGNNYCSTVESEVQLFSYQVFTDLIVSSVEIPATAVAGDETEVTFTVKNTGSVGTGIIPWVNDLYISASPDFSINGATRLASVNSLSSLGPEQTYTDTASITIPFNFEGEYYIFVRADSGNKIPETIENNNITRSGQPLLVNFPPYPDLAVENVTSLNGNIIPGETLTVGWNVNNIGDGSAIGGWSHRVAIVSGTQRLILGYLQYGDSLDAGGTLSLSAGFIVSKHPNMEGEVSLEVRLIPNAALAEKPNSTANNTALSEESALMEKRLTIALSKTSISEDAGSSVQAFVYRSGKRDLALTVDLTASEAGRLDIPLSATIPAGQSGVSSALFPIDNDVIEGDVEVHINANAADYPEASAIIRVLDDEVPSLTLTLDQQEAFEGNMVNLTITREWVTGDSLTVNLSVSLPGQLTVPVSLTIEAGQASATAELLVVEDDDPELDELVSINATATGYLPATIFLMIYDDDLPQLTFTINPSSISEGGGAYATWGTVQLSAPAKQHTVIRLSADTTNQIFFPSQVTIGAGTTQQKFNIGAVDNTMLDGDRDVTITAAIFLSTCSCSAPAETSAFSSQVVRIIDNDGLSLSVSAKPFVVPENITDAGFITIKRNTLGGEAITVNIEHDQPAILSMPATALLPENVVSVEIPFSTLDDGIDAGDQIVTVEVFSAEYSSGSGWIQVTDQNLPDFIANSLSISQSSVMINNSVQLTAGIANQGYAMAPEGVEVSFYRSADKRVDGRDLLMATELTTQVINKGDSMEVSVVYTPDDTVGDYYILAVVNQGGTIRELTTINNNSEPVPFSVMPDYTAVASVDGNQFNGTAPIMITGYTQTISKSPVPNKPVDVYIVVNGTRRVLKATSDEAGAFSIEFVPVNGEAGAYHIGACYPDLYSAEAQDEFTIMGAKHLFSGFIKWDMKLNQPKEFSLPVENLSNIDLTNLRLEVVSAPPGVNVNYIPLLQLNGNANSVINYTVTTSEITPGRDYQEVRMRLTSSQGTVYRFSTWVYSQALKGNMRLDPVRLSESIVRNEINYVEFEIYNNGMDETGDITVMIPSLSWMAVAGSSVIPSLLPGQSAVVTLVLTPGEDLQLNNPISGSIALSATNAPGASVPFTFEPVSTHTGTLLVDVVNEYTYNTAEAPHLEGATVVVTHPYTGKVIAQGVTNVSGHFQVEDIAEGYYNLRVQAPRHSSYQDMVYVEKGIVNKEVVFIGFQAITYSWEVVPTMIQDEYEITLEVVFETNVPAPVVEMIMPDTIPYLNHGETFPFILTLVNHGLIRAENVEITFPDDPEYEFKANVSILDLYPKSSIQIPVVVQRKADGKSMDKSSENCTDFTIASYEFECGPDNQIRLARKDIYFSGRICGSPGSGGIGLPSISWYPQGGSGPGAAPGGGSIYRPFTWESSPYTQSNVGCDPCLVEFLNALWGCSPIPNTFIGGAGKEFTPMVPPGSKNAKKVLDKLLCAYNIGHSIGCKIGDVTGLTKSTLKESVSDLEAAQQNLAVVEQGFEAMINMAKEIYNDEELLEKEGFGLFSDLVWVHLEEEKPFAVEDVNELLIMMAETDVTSVEINGFADRWNVTLQAWSQGIYSPAGEYPAIIDTLLLYEYNLEYLEALQFANERNFSSIEEMYNNAYYIVEGYTEQTSGAVCATVTVQFSQTLTMTREAFEGTLTIFNGHDSDAMQNISLDLAIKDADGVDMTHLFQINPGELYRISGIDGSGTLDAQTEGSAVVIFIPERGAAPDVPVYYSFGGTLSYLDPFTGEIFSQKLFPVTLQVNPSPDLHIDYFMQRDILSDDPFTDEVEPSIPAELAVMINNMGKGDAWSANIESAQPRIVENEKGLMIDFSIVGSNLGGKPTQLGLLNVDFGDIQSGEIAVGQWWFTSSLLGHFISYEVSVNHLNSFGNPDLSLVSDVSVHELIKSVLVYGELNDSINDFLVNDIPDSQDIPDALYYSNGTVAPVHLADSSETDGLVSQINLRVQLSVTPYITGWNYTRLDDPGAGKYRIISCTREDGREIPLDNIWLMHVTIPDGGEPVYENKMHFIDFFADGTPWEYTVVFEPIETDIPEVIAIDGLPLGISDAPVTKLQVEFNKPIDPDSFDHKDLTLNNQGGANLIDSLVKVTPVSEILYEVDLSSKTSMNGYYLFTVQAAQISDLEGNFGQTGKQVSWIQAISIPAITEFFGLPEMPGAPIDELFVLFNMPIVEETFTSERIVLTRYGEEIPSQTLSITPEEGNLPLYRISGLQALSSQDGYYELLFKVTEIQGETGNFGLFDQPAEWSVCSGSRPQVNPGDDFTVCAGSEIKLAALADFYNTLSWTTKGDGIYDDTEILNPVYIPGFNDLQKGSVELCLTAFSNLCESETTACITITLSSVPQVSCPDAMTVNVTQPPFTLSGGLPAGGIYSGAGVTDGSVFSPSEAGIGVHTILYTFEEQFCGVVVCEFVITVSEGAVSCEDVLIAGFPEVVEDICQGQALSFGGVTAENSVGLDWVISPPVAGQMIGDEFYPAAEFTGNVTVSVTATALIPCEDATALVSFTVLPAPVVSITGESYLCPDQTSTLMADSGISWFWNTGETTQSIIVSQPGVYSVTATFTNTCSSYASVTVVMDTIHVSTLDISDITPVSAIAGGIISSNCSPEVIERGVMWNKSGNPTIGVYTGSTEWGTESDTFTVSITDLLPETTYFVRAWARNDSDTLYGDQKQFTTRRAVYTITSTAGLNGTIDPGGMIEIEFGREKTFNILPNEGYRVAEVWVDEQSLGAIDQYTFSNIESDHSIYAEFEPATGLPDHDIFSGSIKMYPNPADDILFIESDIKIERAMKVRYTIHDFTGRFIAGSPITEPITEIHIVPLLPGVYFVRIYHDDVMVRQEKMVKVE